LFGGFIFHSYFYRGQIFQIKSVDSLVTPPLFQLVDLLKDPVKGSYYEKQLKIAPNPSDSNYWTIEKVLRTRKRNGKIEQLVKFQWYPGIYLLSTMNQTTFVYF